MKAFEDYFCDESIIRELCKMRVRAAKKRNDVLFLHKISREKRKLRETHPLDVFPPRRQWHSFRPRHRGNRPSLELNEAALFRATLRLRGHTSDRWALQLAAKILQIRKRALESSPFRFKKPRIIPQEKEVGRPEFRPIASFAIEDKIIDCITARYLRESIDHAFDDSCMAFRCASGGKPAPQFHDALDKILHLQRRHSKRGLFVAECDIKSFFDCVDHTIAIESLKRVIVDAHRKDPSLVIDPRAIEIFEAYLHAYSFPRNVRKGAEPRLKKRRKDARFKWPDSDLQQFHAHPERTAIGVPQGGALSCLIANCVLHHADKVLRRARRTARTAFTYIRYCDDMIILSRSKRSCAAAFRKYQAALQELRLPAHPAKVFTTYSKDFWSGKSKAPYHWRKPTKSSGIPWIQFVGYQLRYDGLVRVRKTSLQKHRRKITALADELFAQTNPGRAGKDHIPPFSPRVEKRAGQIVHRFRQKLISLSVGRCRFGRDFDEPMPMCWVSGYRGLFKKRTNKRGAAQTKKVVKSMVKALDRHRERQIQRVQRRMSSLPDPNDKKGVPVDAPKHYGHRFSYHAQLRSGT